MKKPYISTISSDKRVLLVLGMVISLTLFTTARAQWTGTLAEEAEMFDMDGLPKTLERFPALVEQVLNVSAI